MHTKHHIVLTLWPFVWMGSH